MGEIGLESSVRALELLQAGTSIQTRRKRFHTRLARRRGGRRPDLPELKRLARSVKKDIYPVHTSTQLHPRRSTVSQLTPVHARKLKKKLMREEKRPDSHTRAMQVAGKLSPRQKEKPKTKKKLIKRPAVKATYD